MRRALLLAVLLAGCDGKSSRAGGRLDETFGNAGRVTATLGGQIESARAVLIQPNGQILAAGSAEDSQAVFDDDLALARFRTDGTLDPFFGGGGSVMIELGSESDVAVGLALDPLGRIVVAAQITTAGGAAFRLIRLSASGTPDPTFGENGILRTPVRGNSSKQGSPLAIQSDGRILLAGGNGAADFRVARFLADGSLDPTFGSGSGRTDVNVVPMAFDHAYAIALQPDGKILVGGGEFQLKLVRLLPDGSRDPGFADNGAAIHNHTGGREAVTAIAIGEDGSIVTLSQSLDAVTFALQGVLNRFHPDGSLDLSMGGGAGFVAFAFAAQDSGPVAMALQRDGRIVVAGTGESGAAADDYDFALARFRLDGSFDGGFAGKGFELTDFGYPDHGTAIAIQPDGRIVVAGSAEVEVDADFALARFLP